MKSNWFYTVLTKSERSSLYGNIEELYAERGYEVSVSFDGKAFSTTPPPKSVSWEVTAEAFVNLLEKVLPSKNLDEKTVGEIKRSVLGSCSYVEDVDKRKELLKRAIKSLQ